VQKVYNNRSEIIDLFISKSVVRSRGQNVISFCTYNGSKTNKYFFETDSNQYRFTNDSVEYVPDLLRLKSERGSELYKKELEAHIKALLNKMDDLYIRDITSDWSGVGIDLKIYMKSNGVMLYVSELQKVDAPRFKEYVNSMKNFDKNWYYSMKDIE
jgi:hypothetical protein